MIRVLFYGESPFNPTGFGHVNQHLLAALSRVASVTCVASSHFYGEYSRALYPYEIIGCTDQADLRNLAAIKEYVEAGNWDIFFYQGDIGANNDVLEQVSHITAQDSSKLSIFYMPVDTDAAVAGAFLPFSWCTVPVVYTNHGVSVLKRYVPDIGKTVSAIWLGCEPELFYPLSPEEKRAARLELFGEWALDRFLVVNVNRNQTRKDLARCMAAFHLFHEKHPESTLYMHSVQKDVGGDLAVQAHMAGVDIFAKPAEVAFSALDLSHAWPREQLNRLYNAVDCLVSTSYGEGWGLTTSEAMCAGTPVLVPGNTANLDIIGESQERGWFIQTGGDLDHTTFVYNHGGMPSAFIHSESFVEQLEHIYYHPLEARAKAMKARAWCVENSWQAREDEWQKLIQTLEEHLRSIDNATETRKLEESHC